MSTLVVYWIDEAGVPHYLAFEPGKNQISDVLAACADLRSLGMRFITTASDGSMDGGIVKDGKLPNGEPYTWRKRR